MIKANSEHYRTLVLVFLFAFFFPNFHKFLGSTGSILVNGGLIVLLVIHIIFVQKASFYFVSRSSLDVFTTAFIVFVFFGLHIPLSMIVGSVFGDINIVQRDFYEFHRPVLYFLVFSFAFSAFSSSEMICKLEKLLLFIFIGLVFIGLNQYLGFYDPLSQLYTKQHNVDSRRVSAPFANPYDYAFLISFFVLYFFLKMIYSGFRFALPMVISLIMFITPQSRSVAAAFLVGFFFVLPLTFFLLDYNFKRSVVSKKLFVFSFFMGSLALVFAVSIPFLLENFKYLTEQFVRLYNDGAIGNSASTRLEQIIFILDKANNNLLILMFGNGPAKSELEYVESIYSYNIYRYGLFGLVLYFVTPVAAGSYFAWKVLKRIGRNHPCFPLFFTLLVWFLIIPLMCVGNNFTEQVRLSFFFYSMVGLAAKSYSVYYGRVN